MIPFYYRPYSQQQIERAMAQFAELLAQGFSLSESADRMEVTQGTGLVLFHEIRTRLGAQAV